MVQILGYVRFDKFKQKTMKIKCCARCERRKWRNNSVNTNTMWHRMLMQITICVISYGRMLKYSGLHVEMAGPPALQIDSNFFALLHIVFRILRYKIFYGIFKFQLQFLSNSCNYKFRRLLHV